MRTGISCADLFLVFVESPRDIGGDPGIDTFVGTLKKIDKVGHKITVAFF